MDEREARQLVILHQCKSRTRHLDRLVAAELANERARKRRLSGAEVARQRDEVAGFERAREIRCEAPGRLFIRQCHGKACAPGRCQKHLSSRYSAAVRLAASARGKVHVTVVPCPTAEAIVTSPPCNSTNDRTSESPMPGPR